MFDLGTPRDRAADLPRPIVRMEMVSLVICLLQWMSFPGPLLLKLGGDITARARFGFIARFSASFGVWLDFVT